MNLDLVLLKNSYCNCLPRLQSFNFSTGILPQQRPQYTHQTIFKLPLPPNRSELYERLHLKHFSTSHFYSYSIPHLLVYEKRYQVSPEMTLPIPPNNLPPPPPSFSPCCNSKKRNENTSHLGFPYIHILSTSHLPTLHINLL